MNNPFDKLLDSKIGLGKSQILTYLIVCLIDFDDGAQLILVPLITPLLKKEWLLTTFEVSILTSIFYLGCMIGGTLSGKIGDIYGRRYPLIYSSLLQFFISFCFVFANSFTLMLLMRFFYGFIFGFSLPLTSSMISEICPMQKRGKMLLILNFTLTIGKLYACLLGYIFLEDMFYGNWRGLMASSSLTPLLVFFLSIFVLKESPRYLCVANKFDEAFVILEYMAIKNGKNIDVSINEREEIINWYKLNNNENEKGSIKTLFNKKYLKITIILWIMWFSNNFMYYGQLVILPFLFEKSNNGIRQLVITVLGEAPSILISFFFIDNKKFGRKNSLIITFIIGFFFNFVCYFLPKTHISYFMSFARFFMKISFAFLYVFTPELYGTHIRTLGYGMASSFGKIGSSLMPLIIFPLFEFDNYSFFLLFAILCFLSAFSGFQFPFCTTGRNLDEEIYDNENLLEMKTINLIK